MKYKGNFLNESAAIRKLIDEFDKGGKDVVVAYNLEKKKFEVIPESNIISKFDQEFGESSSHEIIFTIEQLVRGGARYMKELWPLI